MLLLFLIAGTQFALAQQEALGFPLTPVSGDIDAVQVVDDRMRDQNGDHVVYDVRLFRWLPDQSNGVTILYNHGFQSHSAWFFSTAETLRKRGFAVYAFDRIGSGQSDPGTSRSFGRQYSAPGTIERWQLFTQTLDEVSLRVKAERPGDDLIVWANSYGAKVLTAWLHEIDNQKQDNRIKAAIFTTPGLYQNKQTMPLPFSKIRLLISRAYTRFPLPMVERNDDNGASWFIGPGPWFEMIRHDQLSLRDVTRDYYLQTAFMDRHNSKRRHDRYHVPAFFLLVRGDELMDNKKMEQDIAVRTDDGYYKYYEGGSSHKHFLMFTQDQDEVLNDIEKFVSGRSDEISGLIAGRDNAPD